MGTVEQLLVDAGGGGDSVVSDPAVDLRMELDGGPGDDTLAGGSSEDLFPRDDGDGSDTIDGNDGDDTVALSASPSGGDEIVLATASGRTSVTRSNLDPFTLDTGTIELFKLNLLGGDDSIQADPGVSAALVATGGEGDDVLAGGDGDDVLGGGEGPDTIGLVDEEADLGFCGRGSDYEDVTQEEEPEEPVDPAPVGADPEITSKKKAAASDWSSNAQPPQPRAAAAASSQAPPRRARSRPTSASTPSTPPRTDRPS